MGNNNALGRLETVDLRTIWRNEAGDFTPWLGSDENIRLLSDAIGIDLEVHSQEKAVAHFQLTCHMGSGRTEVTSIKNCKIACKMSVFSAYTYLCSIKG